MPILGAPINRRRLPRAVEIARRVGCDCVQIFTKNNNQWRTRSLTDEDVHAFATPWPTSKSPTRSPTILPHQPCQPRQSPLEKIRRRLHHRAVGQDRLGIPYVVTHPEAYTTSSESAGIKAIVRA